MSRWSADSTLSQGPPFTNLEIPLLKFKVYVSVGFLKDHNISRSLGVAVAQWVIKST